MKTLLRRYLVLLTLAFWMGGFTFYTGIVIRIGGQVLGGERDVGFITQQVTNWLNWIGVLALVILAWSTWLERRGTPRLLLVFSWVSLLATQLNLFRVHSVLDQLLDIDTHKIHGPMATFFHWHRIYLIIATAQWLAALAYLWIALVLWRQTDRQAAQINSPAPQSNATTLQR
ncbi:MAG: hypothetical protein JWQ04_725 [Pedosphaera sp.]|nr:hypothetical protein [Pedosphaera sp.]